MINEQLDIYVAYFFLKLVGRFSDKAVSSDVALEYLNECLTKDIDIDQLNNHIAFLVGAGYVVKVVSRLNTKDTKWALTKSGKDLVDGKLFGRGKYTESGFILNETISAGGGESSVLEIKKNEITCPYCGKFITL